MAFFDDDTNPRAAECESAIMDVLRRHPSGLDLWTLKWKVFRPSQRVEPGRLGEMAHLHQEIFRRALDDLEGRGMIQHDRGAGEDGSDLYRI
jgi:hypothetical protein